MFKYFLAVLVVIVCLVFLQKGCERMRSARWDRWDEKKEERKENRDDRKQDRFWNRDDKSDDKSDDSEQGVEDETDNTRPDRERRLIWRRKEKE